MKTSSTHNLDLGVGIRKRRWLRYGILACPGDVIGWIRIPTTIMLLVGAIGLAKYTTNLGGSILKPIHFPPAEWCWILILLSTGFYLFRAIHFFYIKNKSPHAQIYDRAVVPQRWRSF